MIDYKHLCHSVCDIAKEAGAFIRTHVGTIKTDLIDVKGQHDLVTFVDKSLANQGLHFCILVLKQGIQI